MWDFPDQGVNRCLLHWQADSLPLRHQGSRFCHIFNFRFDHQGVLLVNGPSLLLLEDRSPSAFTLSASTIPENVSKTTSCSMMDPMLILHPPGPIVSQWVEQAFKKSNYHFRIIKVVLKGMFKGRHAITEHNILLLMQIQFSDFPVSWA